jgi:peptidyl-prolyl cis-trans isomerase C
MTFRAMLALFLALLAATASAQAAKKAATPAASDDPVVARVNNQELRRSDITQALRDLPPQVQRQPIDKIYPQLLDQMLGTMLVSQAGRKARLAEDPEVKKRLALVQDQIIADTYVQRMLKKEITEAKLKARYDKLMKDAPPREEVSARHILVASEADAKAIIEQLKKGADFAALAKEKTTDPAGKTSGGDLGYFTKDEMVPEFADAAFKLKPGEFTQTPVHTQFGWHVIKVEDRRAAKPPTFEQMKPQLVNDLSRELIQEKMKELRATAKIEIFNPDGSKPGAPPAAEAPAPSAGAAPALTPSLAPSNPPPGVPTLSPATKPQE